jgi:RND family efflux transporter MFP subunit
MPLPLRIVLASLVPLLAGAAVGSYFLFTPRDGTPAKDTGKAPDSAVAPLKLGKELAASYGIQSTPVSETTWREQPIVFGRVVPNPQASAEVRAPFAGVLRPVPSKPWCKLGDHLEGQQPVALLETRLTPQERIDLKAKNAEAQAKLQGAERTFKIQEERFTRVKKLASEGAAGPRDVDAAEIQLLEARTLRDAAQAQAKIYEQVLESPDGKSALVPLTAPLSGEVSELFAQPGLTVEAGYVLMRAVDFKHLLIRLEFPVELAADAPPPEVAVSLATADGRASPATAHFTGSAPQVEAGSQRVALLYGLASSPGAAWRPGLFIRATFPDPTAKSRSAVAVPAAALLYHQGRTLVYVEITPGRYERREVDVLGREGESVVVGSGVRAGEAVVHEQARVLLAQEFLRKADDDD